MNNDFDLGDGSIQELPITTKGAKATKQAKLSAKKQAMLDAVMAASDEDIEGMRAPVGAIVIDEEVKRRPSHVRIIIDEVAGVKENYEVVGVNGVVYQIKRGIPIEVPPEVVHALELAKATHTEQRFNKVTGEYEEIDRSFSAVPWRRA